MDDREKVWVAISEFYLDTELEDSDYSRIVSKLRETDYKFEDIRKIDLYEIFPVLQFNLLGIAGEWAGFDEVWLKKVCQKNRIRRERLLYRIMVIFLNAFFYWMRRKHFSKIQPYID